MTRFQQYLRNFKGEPTVERVFNDAYEMGRAAGRLEMSSGPVTKAIVLLQGDKRRSVYEGADNRGNGRGEFFVDYSDGKSPVLTRDHVAQMVRDGWLVPHHDVAGLYQRGPKLGKATHPA